ncbi:S-methyl-5-thioribose-1-phosphate isomerase [Bacillaceae bacterium SIJ1]|uniref:S-methyl-5-thioribose-1-phosphate isomerase n=1 Tax=Litoribacterium kuwaitense TaxID=1398745 RepID=UPI0013EA5C37|nr:S-methyl-5-thioribose-1-phosphate isomerase [Litoribacterium kuwaitense]NGP45772.1 S-methyl-5-thioribose-1-phosphate isomerase [Litoribacterium kuwaitense]
MIDVKHIESVTFNGEKIVLLDQTKLPLEEVYLEITTMKDLWEAIFELKVRGAPAIGIAAAYGVALGASQLEEQAYDEFLVKYEEISDYLASSRPTAVNLFWALNRMKRIVVDNKETSVADIKQMLHKEADAIKKDDAEICESIGENALTLMKDGMTVLTHCNAGGIATAKYGTALAPIYLAKERGMEIKVFADETRPLLQGARLTTWELMQADVDVTLITDNMAAMVMQQGKIDAVIVGCDRIAANGDTANKIGTYGLAVLAQKHHIPFYVASPLSTIDMETATGAEIPIEERPAKEITQGFGKQTAPSGVKVYNPAFDVTPNELITAIITEKGIVQAPYYESLQTVFE